jgi:prepilin-type N-terminal cleavage/methylation domain-containing protein
MKLSGRNHKGFTLIETIIAIVAAAILGVMAFTYSQTALTKSAQPLNQSQKAMELQKVMENILADYNSNKANLDLLKERIGTKGTAPITTVYGTYTLIANDFVKLVGSDFVDVDPVNDPKDILKVTIKNDLGETLSILLTKIVT